MYAALKVSSVQCNPEIDPITQLQGEAGGSATRLVLLAVCVSIFLVSLVSEDLTVLVMDAS